MTELVTGAPRPTPWVPTRYDRLLAAWRAEGLTVALTGPTAVGVRSLRARVGDAPAGTRADRRLTVHPWALGALTRGFRALDAMTGFPTRPIRPAAWAQLRRHGGFPEPFLRASPSFTAARRARVLNGLALSARARGLRASREPAYRRLLEAVTGSAAGRRLSRSALARQVGVSEDTIRRWLDGLQAEGVITRLRPWPDGIPRGLRKETMLYAVDAGLLPASHGERTAHAVVAAWRAAASYWAETGCGDFEVRWVGDKDGRRARLMVTWDARPWLVATLGGDRERRRDGAVPPELTLFASALHAPIALHLVPSLPMADGPSGPEHPDALVPGPPKRVSLLGALVQLP